MFCPYCGRKLADNANFCGYCGKKMVSGAGTKNKKAAAVPSEPASTERREKKSGKKGSRWFGKPRGNNKHEIEKAILNYFEETASKGKDYAWDGETFVYRKEIPELVFEPEYSDHPTIDFILSVPADKEDCYMMCGILPTSINPDDSNKIMIMNAALFEITRENKDELGSGEFFVDDEGSMVYVNEVNFDGLVPSREVIENSLNGPARVFSYYCGMIILALKGA